MANFSSSPTSLHPSGEGFHRLGDTFVTDSLERQLEILKSVPLDELTSALKVVVSRFTPDDIGQFDSLIYALSTDDRYGGWLESPENLSEVYFYVANLHGKDISTLQFFLTMSVTTTVDSLYTFLQSLPALSYEVTPIVDGLLRRIAGKNPRMFLQALERVETPSETFRIFEDACREILLGDVLVERGPVTLRALHAVETMGVMGRGSGWLTDEIRTEFARQGHDPLTLNQLSLPVTIELASVEEQLQKKQRRPLIQTQVSAACEFLAERYGRSLSNYREFFFIGSDFEDDKVTAQNRSLISLIKLSANFYSLSFDEQVAVMVHEITHQMGMRKLRRTSTGVHQRQSGVSTTRSGSRHECTVFNEGLACRNENAYLLSIGWRRRWDVEAGNLRTNDQVDMNFARVINLVTDVCPTVFTNKKARIYLNRSYCARPVEKSFVAHKAGYPHITYILENLAPEIYPKLPEREAIKNLYRVIEDAHLFGRIRPLREDVRRAFGVRGGRFLEEFKVGDSRFHVSQLLLDAFSEARKLPLRQRMEFREEVVEAYKPYRPWIL
jgi:hypothetical protein